MEPKALPRWVGPLLLGLLSTVSGLVWQNLTATITEEKLELATVNGRMAAIEKWQAAQVERDRFAAQRDDDVIKRLDRLSSQFEDLRDLMPRNHHHER